MFYKNLRLLLLAICFACNAVAQPYYFKHYQVENGLSNNTVFASIQDAQGFMWFGTKDGLNRFDGYRFKTFNRDDEDESSLNKDFVSSLVLNKEGELLAGSQNGLYRFDAVQEKLVPFVDSVTGINEMFVDSDDQLWFISGFSLYRYSFKTNGLKYFPPEKYFNAFSMCQANDGTMWFSSTDGYLYKMDKASDSFERFDMFAHSTAPASRWIEKIHVGDHNNIYVGTSSQGLKDFDLNTLTYKDILTYNPDKTTIFIRDILQSGKNEFWFATESGIFILDTNTGEFTNLRKKYLDTYSLSDNAIYTLCKDREGGIWAGTFFGGLNYYPKQNAAFQKYFPDYSANSISGSAVREICEDGNGNIWIGTEDAGLNKLDPATGEIKQFEPTGAPTDISYTNIHGLAVDKNELWVGTFEHGLDVLDINSGKVKRHYIAGQGEHDLTSNFIVTLLRTRNGEVYAGTSNSLFKYNASPDNFSLVKSIDEHLFISCLLEDADENIWVGTHGSGVYYFNPKTNETGHFMNNPEDRNSITSNSINALFQDSFNNFWFATEGGGVCKLSPDKKVFTRYTMKTGLPSNFVFKVLEDNGKNLWITTSKGLVKLDIKNQKLKIYTKESGLLNDQFNYNSGLKDSTGKMYFGSVRGMVTFSPDNFYTTNFVPPVYITGFQVHNKELTISNEKGTLSKSILFTDKITLPSERSSISIDFAALSFTSPEVTEYSYWMEGLERDWTNLQTNRKVYYTNIPPGSYTFHVKAASNGVWSKDVKKLTITILPPLYATWWAYLIYSLLAASLLYYLVRTYHNRQMNKKEKEIYEAKIEFFTNIAHEIRTPLTLIKGPVENLSEMVDEHPQIKQDVTMMERNTKRLVNLVNQILDFRQTETKGFRLDFTNVNMNELLEELYATFEPLAVKKKLHYKIELPANPVFMHADDEALNKIFTNLYSNAIKYASHTVMIKMNAPKKDDDMLLIEFINDGFPIPAEMRDKVFEPFYRLTETVKQKGTGIGLTLARSLMELHEGKLFIKDSPEKLNIFVAALPLNSLQGKTIASVQPLIPVEPDHQN